MSSLAVAVLAIMALVVFFGVWFARSEGLGLLGPRSTRGINRSAGVFCSARCRTVEGNCPLTGTSEAAMNCPLWKYVNSNMPTALYGSPFTA